MNRYFVSYGSAPCRIQYAGSETDGFSVDYKVIEFSLAKLQLFINELKRKCKYPIEFQKNNLEAYVAVEYTTDQRGYIVKKKVVACDNKKFKKITLDIFDEVKTLKIATTEKIDTIYFQYKIQGSPTLIHSKVDVKIIGYGSNNKSILMK